MGVRNTFGAEGSSPEESVAVTQKVRGEIDQFDKSFKHAVDGTWTEVLSRERDGTLNSKNQQNFILETRNEKNSQAILDPVGLANYLSFTYARGGEKEFLNVLRSDF